MKSILCYLLFAVIIFAGTQTYAQQSGPSDDLHIAPDNGAILITAQLDSLNKRLPVEKVYLHLDKPYYNIGDTLWFKSYLVDRVNMTPSHLSGLLYVELDNDSSEVVRRISIPIKDGLGWGQIPLSKFIFHEGGYTLRAYTNWMQNFGEDYVFSQRFYLGVPTSDVWLVKSTATINQVADKNQLQVQLFLNRADKLSSPVALKKVQVKIYDDWHYIYKEEQQTGIDGSLKFSNALKDKTDGRRIRVQITSLEKDDNNKVVYVPLRINRKQNIDLQFLPEGGNLVAGLKSIVGFKAIGEDGKGTPVAGSIYNSKGTELVAFAAIHNGMGSFEFTPKPGEKYTARLSQPVVKSFELPKINRTGTVMHIDNPENGETIAVNIAGLNSLPTDSACYLIGTSRGVVYYSQKIDVNQPEYTVDKKLFPSGIARIALFKAKRPLNERAVFIDNHDQLSIKITPNKASYLKRDSVGLEIEVKDKSGIPVQGNFSLAVTDDSQIRADSVGNYGIATSLLLNSELKGHVEIPGYYINRKDKHAWQALDNLMLTQGWTGYDWKDVFAAVKPVKFKAETEFKITGSVTNVANKPIPNASVLISSQKPQFITNVIADENGTYEFKNLPTIDSGSFFIQASKADGKRMSFGMVTVDRIKPAPIPLTIDEPILPWYVNSDSTQLNYAKRMIQKANEDNIKLTGRVLKQVEIKAKKIIPNSQNSYGPGAADLVFDEEDIKKSATTNIYELLSQKVPGFKIIGARRVIFRGMDTSLPVLMFNGFVIDLRIDGRPLTIDVDVPGNPSQDLGDNLPTVKTLYVLPLYPRHYEISQNISEVIDALSEYKIAGVTGLEIEYSRKLTNRSGFRPYEWAKIDITTASGVGWFRNRPNNMVTYRPLPVLYPQQFYSPKYGVKPSTIIEPDFRSTLYWEPSIITDRNGKARVSFYTSDIKGKYTVKVAGLNSDGEFGDGTFKINKAAHENN